MDWLIWSKSRWHDEGYEGMLADTNNRVTEYEGYLYKAYNESKRVVNSDNRHRGLILIESGTRTGGFMTGTKQHLLRQTRVTFDTTSIAAISKKNVSILSASEVPMDVSRQALPASTIARASRALI
jgi:hypothetical protein